MDKKNLLDNSLFVKEAESAAKSIQSIVEIADDAIISLDSDQNIILFNQGAEKTFGYVASEILGKSLDLLIPREFVGKHRQYVEGFRDSNERARRMAERGNIQGRRKDGTVFPAEASISKVASEGKFIYTVILRDITARKLAEQELKRNAEELSRSNRDLEQFMYVASHDLQEPLRMVSNFCQLLKEDYGEKFDESGLEYINFAVDGASRMKRLIEDLLAYSRVQRSQAPLVSVSLQRVIDNVLRDLTLRIKEKHAVVTADPMSMTVLGDEVQLGQLFLNIISNALKFCDTDPQIQVKVTDKGEHWEFAVKDNGIGIEPRHFDRIFMIFQRLHTADKYPGTGIGLALCKKIVERHHGQIWVDSKPGQGTTFYVTLPKAVEDKASAE